MVTAAGNSKDSNQANRPYPSSWLDRLQTFVGSFGVSAWIFYLLLWLVHFAVFTGLKWWDGTYPVGTFFAFHAVTWGTAVLSLVFMHYLDESALKSLDSFRPVLDVDDEEYDLLQYRLTHLPAGKTLLAGVAGLVIALGELRSLLQSPEVAAKLKVFTSPLVTNFEIVTYLVSWIIYATFIYHTAHQLRLVSHIYQRCTQVNLFRLDPLHSFSWLTARTAMGIVIIPYIYLLSSSDVYAIRPEWFRYTIAFTFVAGLTFVWPLLGIHRLLQHEKKCLLKEASMQMEAAIGRLHESARAGDLSVMDGLNKLISSLTLEQAVLERISTWPWRPETPRLLATALLLPLIVFMGQRALALTLGL